MRKPLFPTMLCNKSNFGRNSVINDYDQLSNSHFSVFLSLRFHINIFNLIVVLFFKFEQSLHQYAMSLLIDFFVSLYFLLAFPHFLLKLKH